jgi:hypothetical protein
MGNLLVAVAMMLGAFGAVGCNQSNGQAAQPETAPVVQQPEAAPATPAAKSDAVSVVAATTTTRLPAPPALRFEEPGRAPSSHHRWMHGYWRYDAPRTTYVWAPGFWEDANVAVPYGPPALRFEDQGRAPSADYFYAPGYWRWSGREYVWVSGHWSARRDAGFYRQAQWENVNGRWTYRLKPGEHPRTDADHDRRDPRDGGRDRQHVEAERRAAAEHRPPFTGQVTVSTTPVKRGHG